MLVARLLAVSVMLEGVMVFALLSKCSICARDALSEMIRFVDAAILDPELTSSVSALIESLMEA